MSLREVAKAQTINGLHYAVREAGPIEGEPLWMLHGLLDTGAGFDLLAAALDARAPGRFRILAPDWRGHGATARADGNYWFPQYLADLQALIERFTPDAPVTLIGHSMGGQVASLFAGARPDAINRLVALDSLNVPNAEPSDAPRRYRAWLKAQRKTPTARHYDGLADIDKRIKKRYPELAIEIRQRLAHDWAGKTAADTKDASQMHFDPWHRVSFPYGFRADEAMALWREVTAPVLCIDGADSPAKWFTPEHEMDTRRACFADLQRIVVPDAGHMLHMQYPETVAAHIHDFIEARPGS